MVKADIINRVSTDANITKVKAVEAVEAVRNGHQGDEVGAGHPSIGVLVRFSDVDQLDRRGVERGERIDVDLGNGHWLLLGRRA